MPPVSSRKYDEWVSVRISREDREELDRLAEEEERTMNGMIRVAIRELIASRKSAAEGVAV